MMTTDRRKLKINRLIDAIVLPLWPVSKASMSCSLGLGIWSTVQELTKADKSKQLLDRATTSGVLTYSIKCDQTFPITKIVAR